jgi:hypothetical protein
MAMKTNFENSNVISSPFVDEIANPSQGGILGQIERNEKTRREIRRSMLGPEETPAPSSQISKADRDKAIEGTADAVAQARVDEAQRKFGDQKNKNLAKAEGR